MKIKVDPSKFGLLPEDTYDASIAEIKLSEKTSRAGNRKVIVTLQLQSNASDGAEVAGRKTSDSIAVTESLMWKFNQIFQACKGEDMPAEDFDDEQTFTDWLKSELEGETLSIRLSHELYEDQTQVRVNYIV